MCRKRAYLLCTLFNININTKQTYNNNNISKISNNIINKFIHLFVVIYVASIISEQVSTEASNVAVVRVLYSILMKASQHAIENRFTLKSVCVLKNYLTFGKLN